jgi:undecaprenyl-diphosphatase
MDLYLFNLINQYAGQSKILDNLAIFFAEYFQYLIAVILLIVILKNFKKNLPMAVSIIGTVFLSRIVITEIIRHLFFRQRPFVVLENAHLLLNQSPTEPSMPSGHAALFFALATAVYFYNKKLGAFLFISSLLIVLARIFAGVHWPSDVLVGTLIGIFSGWLVNKFYYNFFKRGRYISSRGSI